MPSIAPLVAALQRRLTNPPLPVPATGETGSGQPVQVELFVGGTWVDLTALSSVMVRDDSGQIRITYGITGGEGSQTDRAQGTVQLKNQDGRFSPRNPLGAYYGLIGRNTPMRISVPDGAGGKSYRMWGDVSEWAPNQDTTGNDVWSDVTLSGIMQRLAQAPTPEHSVIYTAITDPLPSSVLAYWPMEDATGAIQLASALTSGSPMTWTGVPTLASYDGFTASDPLPDLTDATLSGGVARYDDPTATQVRFLAYIPTTGLTDGKVLCAIDQLDYGGPQFWELYYSTTDASNSLVLRQCAIDGSLLGAVLPHTLDVRGRLLYVSVELQESGASVTRAVRLTDVSTRQVYSVTDTAASSALTRVTKIQFGPAARSAVSPTSTANLPGVAVGHATLENAITAVDALGVRLNPTGESAGRRIQRLCGEQGIAFESVGDLDDTTALGAQGKQNLLSLAQESTLADGGFLYETRDVLGLGYRTRSSLYNQDPALTLVYGSSLAAVPVPVEDDRYIQNKVTVTVGGVSATYEATDGTLSTELPPAGVGTYGSETTLNLADSATTTLLDQGAWRVHLGTTDEARFPQISVNLAHPSITPDMRRAILALRLGDRIQITSPPVTLSADTIDQLILGAEETLTRFEHRLAFTCAPASPYSYIGYLDTTGRLDTDGSQLLSAIDTSDTSITVIPTDDPTMLWTTDTADFPFDIQAGGEVMTVTGISPAVVDAFGRTTSGGWGSADTGQAWSVAGTAGDYSVGSGYGVIAPTDATGHLALTAAPRVDQEVYVDVAVSAVATGGSMFGGPVLRAADNNNLYMARLEFDTSSNLTFTLRKRVNGSESVMATYEASSFAYTAGTFYRIHFQVINSTLRAMVWDATTADVRMWVVKATDNDVVLPALPTAAQNVGVRAFISSANTNVSPQIRFDNFKLANTQTFTVTRSVNTISKTHPAGEDIRLAHPTIISL